MVCTFFILLYEVNFFNLTMSSTVIDHLQQLRRNKANVAVVYWYFTFIDTEMQMVSNLLCSLIADICSKRRDIPQTHQTVYEQSNNG